jgi:hypothetical protein
MIADLATMTAKTETTADLDLMTAMTETTAALDLMTEDHMRIVALDLMTEDPTKTATTETTAETIAALDLMTEDPTKTAETTITVNEMDQAPTTAVNDMNIMVEAENAVSQLKGSKHCLLSHSMVNYR